MRLALTGWPPADRRSRLRSASDPPVTITWPLVDEAADVGNQIDIPRHGGCKECAGISRRNLATMRR